ncbi:MAG: hypothetical protein KBC17_00550 [Candidatus Pacebacteria bacterium]|nr:hypothetical protein [Candidatus Paceibacterota bacterium]
MKQKMSFSKAFKALNPKWVLSLATIATAIIAWVLVPHTFYQLWLSCLPPLIFAGMTTIFYGAFIPSLSKKWSLWNVSPGGHVLLLMLACVPVGLVWEAFFVPHFMGDNYFRKLHSLVVLANFLVMLPCWCFYMRHKQNDKHIAAGIAK